jgi:putative tryptophan/tyrosine transport system substrate-binding protein
MKKTAPLSIMVTLVLLAVAVVARTQQPTKIPRIGYVSGTGNATNQGPYVEALRQGLRELGHVEGKTFVIEYRGAEGQIERVPSLVEELVNLKVDLLVATVFIRTAKQATKTIPIVMVSGIDPVASGIVESLARPGGNLTGISTLSQDVSGKRLELFKEVVPQLSRLGILLDKGSSGSNTSVSLKEYEDAARLLTIEIHSLEVSGPNPDLEAIFKTAAKLRVGGLITITNANIFMQQKRVADLAIKTRLPSMFSGSTWVDSGGLMSYSTDEIGAYRRAATYVDKILKGAKPADLPVERATKFEFVINLKTANQIGLTIPQWVLVKANRVIR